MGEVILFPDPRWAEPDGLVAYGGNFRASTLLAAYRSGIFPWPSADLKYVWYSPDPRFVLPPPEVHVSRSLRKSLRRKNYRVTFDTAFEDVIKACSKATRRGEPGTWIVSDLRRGFLDLHRQGYAHSVETWEGDELVGGLYGLSLGAMFAGESMFYRRDDASKAALLALSKLLTTWGYRFIDCQMRTEHFERLGGRDWRRDSFLDELEKALEQPTRRGPWTDLAAAFQEVTFF